jgi:HD-GYP domain-containing protein (c-di-GMP phosphodiesterase class II)
VARRSSPLTADEEEQYQLHPLRCLDLARDCGMMTFEQLNGIMHHHERHDGSGYPMMLAGAEIPEFARVLAIADAYDCMTRGTDGKAIMSVGDALNELRALTGTHLDPVLVEVFCRMVSHQHSSESGGLAGTA